MDMNLWKKECLRQSIKPKAADGQTGWAAGLFFLLLLAVFLRSFQQIEAYRAAALYLEDALALSNLASALVDVEEYGISHRILVENPDEAYARYKWAVKGNLNLDDAWIGHEGGFITGTVRLINYTIYNVYDDTVIIYQYDGIGPVAQWQEKLGEAAAPDGRRIEATSVYSEIAFRLKSFPGIEVEARKGKLVDVVR